MQTSVKLTRQPKNVAGRALRRQRPAVAAEEVTIEAHGVRRRLGGIGGTAIRRQVTEALWSFAGHWWTVALACVAVLTALLGGLIFGAHLDVRAGPRTYELGNALKDTADIALKLGAVLAGTLGVYRYWYQKYEPLVYFTSCGVINKRLLHDVLTADRARMLVGAPEEVRSPEEAQYWQNLPLIILHKSAMESLRLRNGSAVDLEFTTPDGSRIWATAQALSFTPDRESPLIPIALSKSLRNYFGIERDHPGVMDGDTGLSQRDADGASDASSEGNIDGASRVSNQWQEVQVNAVDYWKLSESTEDGKRLVWLASNAYCYRFRDVDKPHEVHPVDDYDADRARILEYSGIALRVYRRNAVRYRGSS